MSKIKEDLLKKLTELREDALYEAINREGGIATLMWWFNEVVAQVKMIDFNAEPAIPQFVADEIVRLQKDYDDLADLYANKPDWMTTSLYDLGKDERRLADWYWYCSEDFELAYLIGWTIEPEPTYVIQLIKDNDCGYLTELLSDAGTMGFCLGDKIETSSRRTHFTAAQIDQLGHEYWPFARKEEINK